MVKPFLSVKLKDPQHYYLEDETISCVIHLKLEKVLRNPILRVCFKGRSGSYSNGTCHHYENLFTTEKELSIDKWNVAKYLRKTNEIEFDVEVPNGVMIPSYRNIKGSSGGKIEYLIEASLETAGFLKTSIQASHIIQVPLIAKLSVTENGLQKAKESSIQWPKNEQDFNTCELSAWIPHEGCVRGKDIPIRVNLKQPDRYLAPKSIFIELVCQEIMASGKDSLPNMTKQLDDKIIHKDEKHIELVHESGRNLLACNTVLIFSTPFDITPTIRAGTKVMRLDYKLRVSVNIPEADAGKDKTLSINLPIVVGTTGVSTIHDSGYDSTLSPQAYELHGGTSEGSNSVRNSHSGFQSPPPHHYDVNMHSPPPTSVIGFHIPEPSFHGYPPPINDYPPNRFVLNPQQIAYSSEDIQAFEGMPMPQFSIEESNHSWSNSPIQTEHSMYPPSNNSDLARRISSQTAVTPLYAFNNAENDMPLSPRPDPNLSSAEALRSAFDDLYLTPEVETDNDPLEPPAGIVNKPNSFTPPQTPKHHHSIKKPPTSSSLHIDDGKPSNDTVTSHMEKPTILRLDPLTL